VAGALLQAVIAGVTSYILMWILGIPFRGPLAVLIALLDLIPLVGATIGAVVVGVVSLFVSFPTATIVWVIWSIVYQQVENSVIQPRIQQRAVDVHPFVVLVAVLFGATLLGVLGALVAVPAAASLQIMLREYMRYREDSRIMEGVDPAGGDIATAGHA
jgi:predicted PurR-regulated permease PerM